MNEFFAAAQDDTQAAPGPAPDGRYGSGTGDGDGYGAQSGGGDEALLRPRDPGIAFDPDTGAAIRPGESRRPAPGSAEPDWRAGLGPELSGHEAMAAFASPGDLARAYLSARERLAPPPEEYRLDLPQGVARDEGQIAVARTLARDIGLTQSQLDALVRFDLNRAQVLDQARRDQVVRGLSGLRAQWGPAFAGQLGLARRGAEAFAPPELKASMAADPVLGNHPGLIRLFAELGRRITEDRLVPPGSQAREKSLAELLYPDMAHG